jgi:hypothetical protein
MKRVLDASFLFLHLGLGRGANTNHSDATGELRQPFLQLFAVVVRVVSSIWRRDLIDPALDLRRLAMPSTMVVFSLSTTIRLARDRGLPARLIQA